MTTTRLLLMYKIAQNNKIRILVVMIHLIILLQKIKTIILLMLMAPLILILLAAEF
jgi:hypothetical protein